MILTTPRASCSMKSLKAHRASTLVACSPVLPASQDTGSFASSGTRVASLLALSCLSQLHMLLLSLFRPSMYLMYASLQQPLGPGRDTMEEGLLPPSSTSPS